MESSAEANCVAQKPNNILTVSSRRENLSDGDCDTDEDCNIIPLSFIDSSLQEPIIYVAGFVERSVIKKLKCDTCVNLFNECEPHASSFIKIKSKGFLRYPRRHPAKICEVVQKVIGRLKLENKNCYQLIVLNSFNNLNCNLIFQSFDHHVMECEILENHKYFIIRLIVDLYAKVSLYHLGKQFTLYEHKNYVREKLSKYIHFLGQ